jgi:hypothetical protein
MPETNNGTRPTERVPVAVEFTQHQRKPLKRIDAQAAARNAMLAEAVRRVMSYSLG